ncbi:protein suppressor of hairy wing [Contarinia nasturtii]|uniref:protein suppressor of hairy wing n=1 Tax=Contarinia nasturtii TaxID=265458 RepID=UPI0012D4402C|nr:protein suppressor of hairy wing [Contarinia nasturtii]XP_031633061.1 protein suppressor of hairy wing [Contarinia nasturtii]
MSGLRRSTRATTSTINVKLNEKNEIEYFKVENEVEEIIGDGDHVGVANDDDDDMPDDAEEEEEEEEEEEVIVNADGTMSIKIPEKKKKVPLHHICAKCSKVLSSSAALKRHLNLCKNLPKNAVNNTCDVEFDFSTIDVNDPMYESICICCNEEKETAHYGHVSCNFCPKSFKSHHSLERHLYLLHSPLKEYACIHCNATCPNSEILDAHLLSHDTGKPFSCNFCGKDFTRKYHLDRHLLYTSCDKSRKKQETACHVCGKLFSRTDNLREHLRAHIGQSTRKRDYQCPHCEKSFYGSSLLNIHIRTHTGEKPFCCDLCDKSFPSNGALRKHRRSHTGEKPYTCQTCGKSFSAKETLNRHNKTHTGERPYACTYCSKSFIQATQLRSHMFHHTGENGFTCELCDSKFNRKNRLLTHMLTVHAKSSSNKKSKDFKCSVCDKAYSLKTTLVAHEKTHKIEEPNKCQICGKEFKMESAFKRHMQTKHPFVEKTIDDETIEIIKEDPTKPNTYKIICADTDDKIVDSNYEIETAGETVLEIYEFNDDDECNAKPIQSTVNSMQFSEAELKENIARLLKTIVDEDVLTKFGYPKTPIEKVLSAVIKQCGQSPIDSSNCILPGSKLQLLRENVKLLFTTVIDDESIKEILNNHSIDEAICQFNKISESN